MAAELSGPAPKACIIVPVYNHAAYLAGVLERAGRLRLPLIAVDDGSQDSTRDVLAQFPSVQVVAFPANRGKGSALAAGLRAAAEQGFDLAVSLDADGQHAPEDVPALLAAAGQGNDTLVIGSREFGQQQAPWRSRFGRGFSNFWVRIETGLKLPDTQSGFRVYPVRWLRALPIRSQRYGWETEALVRAAWAGLRVRSVPVRISYAAKPASHFRPLADFWLVSLVNTRLVGRRLWPVPPKKLLAHGRVWPRSWKAKALFFREHYLWPAGQTPGQAAWALGFGAGMAVSPIWGFQMVAALYLAQRLHLNTILVLLACNISLPPLIPFIVYSALVLGRFLLSGQWLWSCAWKEFTLAQARARAAEFIVGSLALSLLTGLLVGAAGYFLAKIFFRPGDSGRP